MHFSRNPPGPKISRIEGLAVAPSVTLPVLSCSSPRGLTPSSSGTYIRSSKFALRLAAVIGVTFELVLFFGRVHLRVQASRGRNRYDNIPLTLPRGNLGALFGQ